MRFFFAAQSAQICWSKRPRFRDKELAGISLSDTPDGLVADKLVEVYLRDGGIQWMLIHIEVQAQRDASFARRVYDYNYRINKEYGQAVASLVVLADEDPKWRPHTYHADMFGTATTFSFLTPSCLTMLAGIRSWRRRAIRLPWSHFLTCAPSKPGTIQMRCMRPSGI